MAYVNIIVLSHGNSLPEDFTLWLQETTAYTVIERWIEEGSVRPPLTTKRPLSITNVTLPDGTGQALLDQDRGV